MAALAGLERALQLNDPEEIEMSIRRIALLHSIIFSIGGIPLIYLGDEVGWLNDYSYRSDPAKATDSRWVHRPLIDWEKMERRSDPNRVEGRIYQHLQRLIRLRKGNPGFGGNQMEVVNVGNEHVFAYVRTHAQQRIVVLANFAESEQTINANEVRLYGLGYHFHELISDSAIHLEQPHLSLHPYQVLWLVAKQ